MLFHDIVIDGIKLNVAAVGVLRRVGPVVTAPAVAVEHDRDVIAGLLVIIPGQIHRELERQPVGERQGIAQTAAAVRGGGEVAVRQLDSVERGLGPADIADTVHAEVMVELLAADRAGRRLGAVRLVRAEPETVAAAIGIVKTVFMRAGLAAAGAQMRLGVIEMDMRCRLGRRVNLLHDLKRTEQERGAAGDQKQHHEQEGEDPERRKRGQCFLFHTVPPRMLCKPAAPDHSPYSQRMTTQSKNVPSSIAAKEAGHLPPRLKP